MTKFVSARTKAAAVVTGVPAAARSHSGRANAAAVLTGATPQPGPQGGRARAAAVGQHPATQHLGKSRTIPHAPELNNLVGQVVHLPDGRAVRVLGLDVLLPATERNYAAGRSYGCAADATFVSRMRPTTNPHPHKLVGPLDKPGHTLAADATAVARRRSPSGPLRHREPVLFDKPHPAIAADATAVPRPFDPRDIHPKPPPVPLTPQQAASERLGAIEKYWNGSGAVMEGYGLVNKTITPVNNSAFQLAQRINRLAKSKVIVPSHLASRSAAVVRGVAPGRRLGSLLGDAGKIAGPVGMVLTSMSIGMELKNNTWDAHTVINGVLLVVTAAGLVLAGTAAAPVLAAAGAVIAIYGVLDFAFDLSGQVIDPAIGRKSGLWD